MLSNVKLALAAAMAIAASAGTRMRSYWRGAFQSEYHRSGGGKYKPHQGKQERERRLRNIKRGLETAQFSV